MEDLGIYWPDAMPYYETTKALLTGWILRTTHPGKSTDFAMGTDIVQYMYCTIEIWILVFTPPCSPKPLWRNSATDQHKYHINTE